MAITSIGYPGTVNSVQDAKRSPHIGSLTPVVVGAATSLKVTVNTGADRTVNVAAGPASGCGVYVNSDAVVSVQLDTIGSSNRWDAIVLRRDWGTNTSTIIKVTNALTNSKTLPTLVNNPGVQHDQVLALAQVIAGQSQVQSNILDLRARASKVITAGSLLAIPFPELGMIAEIAGVRYTRALDSGGNPAWVPDASPITEATSSLWGDATGWDTTNLANRVLIDAKTGELQFDVEVRRSGANIVADNTSGNFTNSLMLTVNTQYRPDRLTPIPLQYAGGAGFTFHGGWGEVNAAGQFTLQQGSAGVDLLKRTGATDVSVRASFRYGRKP